jgi:hypothetical protein
MIYFCSLDNNAIMQMIWIGADRMALQLDQPDLAPASIVPAM